jgi:hypothetical protein
MNNQNNDETINALLVELLSNVHEDDPEDAIRELIFELLSTVCVVAEAANLCPRHSAAAIVDAAGLLIRAHMADDEKAEFVRHLAQRLNNAATHPLVAPPSIQ